MNTLTLGIDLAKNVFSLHGVNQKGKTVIRKTVKRQQLIPEVAKLPPALIGMEACSGAHYWVREFIQLGHDARIMAPKYVARIDRVKKTTVMMLRPSAKLLVARRCALCRLKPYTNRHH